MVSFFVYKVYLFLISRQTYRFFFDVCMSMQLMQVLTNCNVLNATKLDAVHTDVCGIYATLQITVYPAYRALHPSKRQGYSTCTAFCLVGLAVHQSKEAALTFWDLSNYNGSCRQDI